MRVKWLSLILSLPVLFVALLYMFARQPMFMLFVLVLVYLVGRKMNDY
jgi:hypothetical protein